MATARYVPERRDVVWLDFEPVKGGEIGKHRPALVLSSREYNAKTGLLICCPISTGIRGAITEVSVASLEQPSVIVANIVQTLSWKERKAKKIGKAGVGEFRETLVKLLPLIGAEAVNEPA